jgi:hypothetical protein
VNRAYLHPFDDFSFEKKIFLLFLVLQLELGGRIEKGASNEPKKEAEQ